MNIGNVFYDKYTPEEILNLLNKQGHLKFFKLEYERNIYVENFKFEKILRKLFKKNLRVNLINSDYYFGQFDEKFITISTNNKTDNFYVKIKSLKRLFEIVKMLNLIDLSFEKYIKGKKIILPPNCCKNKKYNTYKIITCLYYYNKQQWHFNNYFKIQAIGKSYLNQFDIFIENKN